MSTTLLYLNNTDPATAGGGDRRMFEEAKVLADQGLEVRLVTSRTDPSVPKRRVTDGVKIRNVKCVPDRLSQFETTYFYLSRSLFPLVSLPVLAWLMWQEDIDLMLDNFTPHPSLVAFLGIVGSFPSIAIVHEYHDRSALSKYPLPVGIIQLIVQNLLRTSLYSAVVVPHKRTREEFQNYGVELPIHVIPNGIDFSAYSEKPEGVQAQSFDLLVVSRLVHRKGIDQLIRAMSVVLEQQPETRLGIVGRGPRQEGLQALARECDVADNMEFLGYVSENRKIGLLHAAEVFVMPSRQEGFGIAVLEAMATGTPVVVSNLEILYDLVPAETEMNFFVNAGDPEEFGAALTEMLSAPSQRRKAIGERNRDRAAEFSWQAIGAKAKETYSMYCDSITVHNES